MDAYLGVAEDRAEGSSQMCPQGKSIHNKVLLSGGKLHQASEALEASVVVMLQIDRNLFGNRKVLHHGVHSCLSIYKGEWRLFQSL